MILKIIATVNLYILYEIILNNIIINNIIFLIIRSICIFIYLWICEKWIDEVILQILKNSTSYFSIYFYIIVYVYTYELFIFESFVIHSFYSICFYVVALHKLKLERCRSVSKTDKKGARLRDWKRLCL